MPPGMESLQRHWAVVFQGKALLMGKTAGYNIALPLREVQDLDESTVRSKVDEAIREGAFNTDWDLSLTIDQLSGGMAKRVGIAALDGSTGTATQARRNLPAQHRESPMRQPFVAPLATRVAQRDWVDSALAWGKPAPEEYSRARPQQAGSLRWRRPCRLHRDHCVDSRDWTILPRRGLRLWQSSSAATFHCHPCKPRCFPKHKECASACCPFLCKNNADPVSAPMAAQHLRGT